MSDGDRSLLREELLQKKPFSSTGLEAALALMRTSDELRRRNAAILEKRGLERPDYNILRILRGAGPDGLPPLPIAVRMVEREEAIGPRLENLEHKGLISRRRVPDLDGVRCCATDGALELLAELDGPMNASFDGYMSRLSEEQQRQLIGLLEKLRES